MSLLKINNLTIHFPTEEGDVRAVNGISFAVEEGKTLGLVGETGAGKTTTALGILNLVPEPGVIESGTIEYNGKDIVQMSQKELHEIRGNEITMIFQDPMTALNPVMTVGDQIIEVIARHQNLSGVETRQRMLEILGKVGISSDRAYDYPHQFSGGMKQRIVIAIALACNPKLLLADEPTTALDVTIQAQVMSMINDLKKEFNTAMILITHDLGIVAESCDDVAIMYAGKIVEMGALEDIFNHASHPYTKGLFNSIPSLEKDVHRLIPIRGLMPDPANLPSGCAFHPRCPYATHICSVEVPPSVEISEGHVCSCHNCKPMVGLDVPEQRLETAEAYRGRPENMQAKTLLEVSNLTKYFKTPRGMLHAVEGVNFSIREGETLGVVGESGCGKSTLGRTVMNLLDCTGGQIKFDGQDISHPNRKQKAMIHSNIQMIFQDPASSLDPRKCVSDLIAEPLRAMKMTKGKKAEDARVAELMDTVGLARRLAYAYPHELDGGRRQRIGVARALAVNPKFIVCDEPVSALDVSIQAQIINLLQDLQDQFGFTYMFITHNLSVVKHISHDILVMYLGCQVEKCRSKDLFSNPLHPYTKGLLSAIPIPSLTERKERIVMEGEVVSPINPKPGCRFAARCPYAGEKCTTVMPEVEEVLPGHFCACHYVREINGLN